jgi:hypothetical protein
MSAFRGKSALYALGMTWQASAQATRLVVGIGLRANTEVHRCALLLSSL